MGRKNGLKGQNRAVEGRENVVIKPFSPSVEGVGKKGQKGGENGSVEPFVDRVF